MSIPITYSLLRYLAAKKSVDDRALNWQVWQHLVAALPRATPQQPLRILEVGAGIGSMVERLRAAGPPADKVAGIGSVKGPSRGRTAAGDTRR